MATEREQGFAAARALGAFRIAFGVVVACSALRTLWLGRVGLHYLEPSYTFSYSGLEFLSALPASWAYPRFVALGLCGLGLALGRGARVFAALIALLFTWNHLVDKSLYLNHYHLVSLVALVLAFLPSGRAFVWGRALRPVEPRARLLVQALFALVWFHAGLAKLHPDWLWKGQPLGLWLAELGEGTPCEALCASPRVALALSWAALLHDLAIPGLLFWQPTRRVACVLVVGFHLATAALFPVGIFPFVMLAGVLTFLDWSGEHPPEAPAPPRWSRAAAALAAAFLALHALVPLRGWFAHDDLHWHEEGFRFSWRVMVMEKRGDLRYTLVDAAGRTEVVRPEARLTALQARMLATQPDMILQFAHHLAAEEEVRTGNRPRVYAEAWASLNGGPTRRLIDPACDLAALPLSASTARYVTPR